MRALMPGGLCRGFGLNLLKLLLMLLLHHLLLLSRLLLLLEVV
jgi:hypothetical protein